MTVEVQNEKHDSRPARKRRSVHISMCTEIRCRAKSFCMEFRIRALCICTVIQIHALCICSAIQIHALCICPVPQIRAGREWGKKIKGCIKNDIFSSYMLICLSILEMASLKHNVVPKIGDVIAYMRKWGDGLGDEFFQSGSFMKMRRSRRRSICC